MIRLHEKMDFRVWGKGGSGGAIRVCKLKKFAPKVTGFCNKGVWICAPKWVA